MREDCERGMEAERVKSMTSSFSFNHILMGVEGLLGYDSLL